MPAFKASELDFGTIIQVLEDSVRRNLTDGLLLSGGLDTTILAYLASKSVKIDCLTVALKGAPALDIDYARLVASRLGLKHYLYSFGDEELDEGIRASIRVMKSFDPMEIRNSAAIYVALKVGRDRGLSTFMTGDGGDELFGGYDYLFKLTKEQLETALKRLQAVMRFSSMYLAKALGIEVKLPYLDPEVRAFAQGLDASLKIRSERGQVWGKWILRKAFENVLPPEIIWRVKAPIESGTGTSILPAWFESKISATQFSEKKQRYLNEDRVNIRSKEHLFYYEIYRSIFGIPYLGAAAGKACPDCGSKVAQNTSFCRTCGAYPI